MDELTLAGTLGLGEDADAALFFILGKSAKKTLHLAHLRLHEHQLESAKKRMNSGLGESLQDLHQKRGYQRSAPQPAQKCVPEAKKSAVEPCP